uniref:Uncharacterized protein n=1 Tax=Aegilops tauschii subsp. strangulata TaxID=200361 RepID=A0A453BVR3_AEGTS
SSEIHPVKQETNLPFLPPLPSSNHRRGANWRWFLDSTMKSPLRKFRGLALPHHHKEKKDQRPPPAKLDNLVDAAQRRWRK